MNKLYSLIFCLCIGIPATQAQSLKLIDLSNQADISGTTIMLQSPDNQGWVGYESLNIGIKLINTSGHNMIIGAKKVEHDTLQPDVEHTICFANNCFPSSTFISPFYVTLNSGDADSSFSGHFLFDNSTHIRGINHISYIFYNTHNPSDSVEVKVVYNTIMLTTGIEDAFSHVAMVIASPNPANDWLSFRLQNSLAYGNEASIILCNVEGKTVRTAHFSKQELSMDILDLPAGVYFYRLWVDNQVKNYGKVMVVH